MKYNRRVQLYLSEENAGGRYFRLKNGKSLYLRRFKGQPVQFYGDDKKPSTDLKEAFRDLLTEAYEMGVEEGKDAKTREVKENLAFLKSLLK
jgi:hypothetical protein